MIKNGLWYPDQYPDIETKFGPSNPLEFKTYYQEKYMDCLKDNGRLKVKLTEMERQLQPSQKVSR